MSLRSHELFLIRDLQLPVTFQRKIFAFIAFERTRKRKLDMKTTCKFVSVDKCFSVLF